jgi:hypothetical protein
MSSINTRILLASAALLLFQSAGHAATLNVRCGGHEGLTSISAALKALQNSESHGPPTVNVTGNCHENILIQNVDRLTLNAVNGASITDASNGTSEVIDVANSHGFTLNGFTITTTCDATCLNSPGFDAVSCYFGADCLLINNTISGAGNGSGVGVYALSKVTIQGGTLHDNWAGAFTGDSGEMFVLGTTIQNNYYGVFMNHGGHIAFRAGIDGVTPSVIAHNTGQGIFTNIGSTVNVKAPASITANGADGMSLALGTHAFVGGGGPGVVSINGNGGPGISVNDAAVVLFGNNAQVTGNGQPDVACNAETAVTQGAMTKIGGGSTNCTDGAPKSANVLLTSAHISGDQGSSVLRAFILTDSADSACFVTFNESNSAGAGESVFCGVRSPSLYGGRPGVMVTVFFPGPVASNVALSLNIHQNGAKQYGSPIACTPTDGC